jgi:mono/diheme cytochrome c family protein
MHGVEPVKQANRDNEISWPLSMRWPLGIWRKTFVPVQGPMDLTKYADQKIARGAYLVQSLGHCGSCHTPRAATLNELALDESGPEYLAGGPLIDGWLAVNLRGDKVDGMGNWTAQDIVDTLKTARNKHSGVLGEPMQDVVKHSTQNMLDADLMAMALYIKSLPKSGNKKATFAASDATVQKIMQGNDSERGVQLYLDNCAACHRVDGKAAGDVFPALPGNPTVLQEDPTSLIRVILAGARLPSTHTAPSDLGMPGFAWRLSDEETAQLVTFVRSSWGNQASPVGAAEVAKVRKLVKEHELHTADKGDTKH